jgi:hypothetical protein
MFGRVQPNPRFINRKSCCSKTPKKTCCDWEIPNFKWYEIFRRLSSSSATQSLAGARESDATSVYGTWGTLLFSSPIFFSRSDYLELRVIGHILGL